MGKAETPSEFEYSASFLRILIPGIIAVALIILASFLVMLKTPDTILFFKNSISQSVWAVIPIGVIFITASIIFGFIVNVFITQLIRILEGYPSVFDKIYFVHFLKDKFHERQCKKFAEYYKVYDLAEQNTIERAIAYNNLYYYFSCPLYEITKNPRIKIRDDKNELSDELKKCILPTELGNVFQSMEIYPQWKYGMDGVFFWNRLELLVSDENRKTLDKMRAFVDMFVELTWIFLVAAIVYLVVLVYNGKYFTSVASLVVFILFSLGSYNMAVQSALDYGFYVRSIFDLYREELWNKIKKGIFNKLDTLPENERWDNIFGYLYHFTIIQCQKCRRFYDSREEHTCPHL